MTEHIQPLSLSIAGMHCGNCVARVARALTSLASVQVHSLEIGSARVTFDPARVGEEEIVEAVGLAGYSASVVNE